MPVVNIIARKTMRRGLVEQGRCHPSVEDIPGISSVATNKETADITAGKNGLRFGGVGEDFDDVAVKKWPETERGFWDHKKFCAVECS
jgi:hypothetical protein